MGLGLISMGLSVNVRTVLQVTSTMRRLVSDDGLLVQSPNAKEHKLVVVVVYYH